MKRTNQEYEQWIKCIEDAFASPNGIVGEDSLVFKRNEEETAAIAPNLYHGFYVRLMDSFFDFALKCLNKAAIKPELYDMSLLVSSLWTIRSAYNTFWQGYFCNATALLRSAFEGIAILKLERDSCPRRFELCKLMENAHKQGIAPWDMKKEAKKLVNEAQNYLFGKTSGLDPKDQKMFSDFLNILHSHVHLSFFSFFVLFKTGKQTGRIGILPKFDNTSIGSFVYASEAIAWIHLRLQWSLFVFSSVDSGLKKKFCLLNDAFTFASSEWSDATAMAWRNCLDKRFPLLTPSMTRRTLF